MKTISRTMMLCAGVGVLLAGLCPETQAALTPARVGRSDYTMVLGKDCSPSERHGAAELQMFLKQISEPKLPIGAGEAPGPRILVGRSKALDRLVMDERTVRQDR